MIVNILAALVIAHRQTPFEVTWPVLMMLAAALFSLLHGPGRPSVDVWLRRPQAQEPRPIRSANGDSR